MKKVIMAIISMLGLLGMMYLHSTHYIDRPDKFLSTFTGSRGSNQTDKSLGLKTKDDPIFDINDPLYVWKIACEQDFPPYNYIDETGKKTGLDTEIISAVMHHLNINFEIVNYPWKRVVYSVDNNHVDCAFQFVGKPERFKKYWMVGPFRDGITLFSVKKESSIKDYSTLEDLKPYRIGHVLGYAYTPEFDEASYLNKETGRNNTLLINMLVKNRVDLMIGDLNTLSYTAKLAGNYNQIRFLPTIVKKVPRYIAFPRERKEQADWFTSGLDAIKKNGTYDQILKKWL